MRNKTSSVVCGFFWSLFDKLGGLKFKFKTFLSMTYFQRKADNKNMGKVNIFCKQEMYASYSGLQDYNLLYIKHVFSLTGMGILQ